MSNLTALREQLALYLANCDDVAFLEQQAKAFEPVVESAVKQSRYDPRNTLNDLSGAEWVYFLNSVETTAYSTKGREAFSHHLRKAHPSPKPPQLMRRLIEFFTKKDASVLDPFMGVGGTLLGCSLSGRRGVGVDLSSSYLDIYAEVCRNEKLDLQQAICGDSRNIIELSRTHFADTQTFDLILTDPPYGDMLSRNQTGENKKRTGRSEATPFTGLETDIGNLPLPEFLRDLRCIIERSFSLLKPKGYCIIFCKDLQPTPNHHNLLHADVVNEMLKIEGMAFKGCKIWYDQTPRLYPFGYPYAFVANQLHQYILIFRKELRTPKKSSSTKQSVTKKTNTNA